MPAIFPGEYIISHGAWPLPAPAKPGQAISITLGNPSDIQYDAWNIAEAPPLEVLGPIVRGYYIMTQDKRAYLALQDPATGKGDLTTSTDPTQAVRFFVDPNFFGLQAPVAIYTISAAGGLVTLVPPPKHITGTLGNVQLLPRAAPNETGESQLWFIRPDPAKVSGAANTVGSHGAALITPDGRFFVANGGCALVPGNPGSTIGMVLNPSVKQAWYLEPAPAEFAIEYPNITCHVLRTDTGDLYLSTIGFTYQAPPTKEHWAPGIVLMPVDATVTANHSDAWVFTLEGDYKDGVFTGKLVSPDGRYTFINQPPPKGSLIGAAGIAKMSPTPEADQTTWTLQLALL